MRHMFITQASRARKHEPEEEAGRPHPVVLLRAQGAASLAPHRPAVPPVGRAGGSVPGAPAAPPSCHLPAAGRGSKAPRGSMSCGL